MDIVLIKIVLCLALAGGVGGGASRVHPLIGIGSFAITFLFCLVVAFVYI